MKKHPANRLIDIIEDYKSLCDTLPVILDAVTNKELPRVMNTFNDSLTADIIQEILEKATGKRFYE